MKNTQILTVLVAIVLLFSTNGYTQNRAAHTTPAPAVVAESSVSGMTNVVTTNDISAKVLKNFARFYSGVTDAKWFKSGKDFRVHFTDNGIKTILYYKSSGMQESKILSYTEAELDEQVRHFVKSRFYDYTILHVTEVSKNGSTAYYIKIEDKYLIRTLKIVEEEYEITETLVKE